MASLSGHACLGKTSKLFIVCNSCPLIIQVWVCRPSGEGRTDKRLMPCWSTRTLLRLLDKNFSKQPLSARRAPITHVHKGYMHGLLSWSGRDLRGTMDKTSGWGVCVQDSSSASWLLEFGLILLCDYEQVILSFWISGSSLSLVKLSSN